MCAPRTSAPPRPRAGPTRSKASGSTAAYWWQTIWTSLIGLIIGILPGAGATVAAFLAYHYSKMLSKTPELYGTGHPPGVIAPESANNGVTSGTLVPVFALGIPGGTTGAIMMIVLTYHGVVLGPRLFIERADLVYSVYMQMLVCYLFMIALILPMARYMSRVVWVPTRYLVPLILSLITIAAFSEREYIFDMGLALFFGLIGYFARKGKFEISAMLIGVIMGPLFETYFLRSMRIGQGDLTILFSSTLGQCAVGDGGAGAVPAVHAQAQEDRRAGADGAGRPRKLRYGSTIVAQPRDHGGRRRIGVLHHALHLLAGLRRDLDPKLLGLGQQVLVAQRRIEGTRAGSRPARPAPPAAPDRISRTPAGTRPSGRPRLRSISFLTYFDSNGTPSLREFRLRLDRGLHQEIELFLAQPFRLLRFERRPVEPADAVDLAARHGEEQIRRPLVAATRSRILPRSHAGPWRHIRGSGLPAEVAPMTARLAAAHPRSLRTFECCKGHAQPRAALGAGEILEFDRVVLALALIQQADRGSHWATPRRSPCRPWRRAGRDSSPPCCRLLPACCASPASDCRG